MPGADYDQHPVFGSNTNKENYLKIAELLIDNGIDTSVCYDMTYGKQIDAMMFALIWDREDIAHLIADHQASGDAVKAEKLFNEAKAAVAALV